MNNFKHSTVGLATEALDYWRANCSLVAAHVFGLPWPSDGDSTRGRFVGHWGANPGIAWIVGHLAACWAESSPILVVLGTGHATSFLVAHQALKAGWKADFISSASARYGQPGGEPSELVGWPAGIPFLSGELGPALGVSQGLAKGLHKRVVACIVGDGECESPVALAALAHREVLLHDKVQWLPIVNANGARMGGPARFDISNFDAMLRGFGYEVVISTASDPKSALEAAKIALEGIGLGLPMAWISATEKGWPAPEILGGRPFRGAEAHKPPRDLNEQGSAAISDLKKMIATLSEGLFESDGRAVSRIRQLAQNVTFSLPLLQVASSVKFPVLKKGKFAPDLQKDIWQSPMEEIDDILAQVADRVFCPDEGQSNRLLKTKNCGLLVEVIAEELCVAWAIGSVEAGQTTAIVTYEAFAPLLASQVAQYAKLVHGRSSRGLRPLLVIQTSLGWGNSPTHQNTDLVATFICRPLPGLRVLCPLGATSARMRLKSVLQDRLDETVLINCSKQRLLDVPDPGGSVVELAFGEAPEEGYQATIIAIGDVCLTEALAAMKLALEGGCSIRVLAVVELTALDSDRYESVLRLQFSEHRVVAVTWCAPRLVEGLLWQVTGTVFPVVGYRENSGATPWETLVANGMDRFSLLSSLDLDTVSRLDKDVWNCQTDTVPFFNVPTFKVCRSVG